MCGIVSECQVRVGSAGGVMDRSWDTCTMWQSAPQDTSSPVLALLCASCSPLAHICKTDHPPLKMLQELAGAGGIALHCQLWQKYNFILQSVLRAGTRDSAKWGAAAAELWLRGSESLGITRLEIDSGGARLGATASSGFIQQNYSSNGNWNCWWIQFPFSFVGKYFQCFMNHKAVPYFMS